MSDDNSRWTCAQCGANVESTGNFCPFCGKNRMEVAQAQGPNATMPTPAQPRPVNKKAPIIALVVVSLIVASFFYVAYQGYIVIEGITKPVEVGEGERLYEWTYEGREYVMKLNITDQQYEFYADISITRHFTSDYWGNIDYDHVADFITPWDPVIAEVATNIIEMGDRAGLSDYQTLELALAFVQYIPYRYDIDQFQAEDYWTFPVETLVNYAGDCEDTGFLFASIAEAMGVDAAIIIYEDHIAAGVASEDAWGTYYTENGVDYFYCETTGIGWKIGQIPEGRYGAHVVDV